MMSFSRKKSINKTLIAFFVAGSLVNISLSAMMMHDVGSFHPDINNTLDVRLSSECERSLLSTGHKIIPTEGSDIAAISLNAISTPELSIGAVSLAIQSCYGYELKEFCMGEGCSEGELTVKLRALF
jgi:hypothetical protein